MPTLNSSRSTVADFVSMTSLVARPTLEMIVFPIIKALYFADGTERHTLVGTGFFIAGDRRFLTARHVFVGRGSALDQEDAQGIAVYCVHTIDLRRTVVARHIDVESIRTRGDTDIATGVVLTQQFGRPNPAIAESALETTAHFSRMRTDAVPVGSDIYTIAYPLATVTSVPGHVGIHAQSDMYTGQVTEHYPRGRDSSFVTWPCYETTMEVKGAASGGPVLLGGSDGEVFAVNSTSIQPHVVSYVSALTPLVAA